MSWDASNDDQIDSLVVQLQSKLNSLGQQQNQVRSVLQSLQKIRTVLIPGGTSPPPDPDMNNDPMDLTRRKTIFDTNIAAAKSILGIK